MPGDLNNRLSAFHVGADDVLTIPFVPEELLERVSGALRHAHGEF